VIDDVILGCIGQQSDAPNIGRVAGLLAGVPANVPGYTVQRNCVSGMVSITSPPTRPSRPATERSTSAAGPRA
jgi:acetyl-CoA acetyltransferase